MNIFVLSLDPREAATMMCNKHVVKMIVESAQILCTVAHKRGVDVPYLPTHQHHPCVKWTAASLGNQAWLQEHFLGLCDEYTRRYHRIHATEVKLAAFWSQLASPGDWTRAAGFAQAMPNEWRIPGDPVTAYRCYYIAEKSLFARWHPRAQAPSWWPFPET